MAEPQITTKDVVLELNRKVDGLVSDMAEVKVLAAAVASQTVITTDHEARIRALEEKAAESVGVRRWWDSFWARVVGAAALLGSGWWLPDLIHKKF